MNQASETTSQPSQQPVIGGVTGYRPWLHRFALTLVVVTFMLVMLGGTVTSKGVGLAVPDWPQTYGYNMFLFPISMWTGGVFWEHTHRLLGALVGMMTIIMTAWLWATQRHRPWLCGFGDALLAMVIIQGVMGGLRVTELSTTLAVTHGVTAQIFLCMTLLVAVVTSRHWLGAKRAEPMHYGLTSPRWVTLALLVVVVAQLTLGAVTRHTGSGLAIPDFPASYGGVLPPFSEEGIIAEMDEIPYEEATFEEYYKPYQVAVHFAHRVGAVVVTLMAVFTLIKVSAQLPHLPRTSQQLIRRPLVVMLVLLLMQFALGALVIWSVRHPELATAHQVTGAALLATVFVLTLYTWRILPPGSGKAASVSDQLPSGVPGVAL